MGEHNSPAEPTLSRTEPEAVAEGARVLLGALVALGWISLDDATTNAIITAVAALASIALTHWSRRRVTPVAKLNDENS